MIKIWNQTGFVENDPWVIETEDVTAGEGEHAVIGLHAFLEAAECSNESGFGVLIAPADDVTKLAPYLDRVTLVAISFPVFSDGRGFSHATLLRQRLGYAGELRAVGDVLIDQVPLMLRTGVTSFAVSNPTALKRLAENRLPGIAEHYQPSAMPSIETAGFSWRRTGIRGV
ncbi:MULTISPECIES: DUF934 domain-containing protein [Alphaproteobacteria]|nr:DUF934 domain-containing protein [Ciceribacter naphthalenivorans]